MKKKKSLAFVLACILCLAPFALTISANTSIEYGRTLDELTSIEEGIRVSDYGTPTIDGTKDNIYTEYGHVSSNFNSGNNEAAFEAYYANDGSYLYVYMDVTMPADKVTLDGNDFARIYIDFYNKHTKIYKATNNEYMNAYLNGNSSTATVAGSAIKYNGGQFQYTPLGDKTSGGRGAANGIGSVANGDVAYVISYDDAAKTDVASYVIEARIVLPDYVKASISAGKQPVIGVGYEVRNANSVPKYKVAYLPEGLDGSTYFGNVWGDYTVAGDLILSTSTSTTEFGVVENPACSDILGKTVTVNGTMGSSEGWATLPYVLLNNTTSNGTDKTGVVTSDVASVRYSADDQNLYIYYESYNTNAKNAYFQVAYGKDADGNFYTNESKDNFVSVALDLEDTQNPIESISWKEAYTEGIFFEGTKAAIVRSDTKVCAEVKIPMSTLIQLTRVNGPYDIMVGAYECTDSTGAGFVATEGYDATKGMIALTLPQVPDKGAETLPQWIEDSKQTANYTALQGITVNVMGDSYLAGSGLDKNHIWTSMLATKYGWTYSNAAEDGRLVSTYNGLDNKALAKTYRGLNNNNPAVVIVSGGQEDFLKGVPIGTVTDTTADTFMGALNVMFDGLRVKYADAMIVYTTMWNIPDNNADDSLTYEDYVKAAEDVCKAQGVYCFKAYDESVSGVDMSDETFTAQFCKSAEEIGCLNLSGMKLVMPEYEAFLAECLADWAVNKDTILANRVSISGDKDDEDEGDNSETETDDTEVPEETEAADDTEVEEKKGCGSVIGMSAMAIVAGVAACTVAYRKRKED